MRRKSLLIEQSIQKRTIDQQTQGKISSVCTTLVWFLNEMLAVAPSTIWNWHRRYRAEGVNGLANRAKSGRPAKADDHYLAEVEQALDTDPRELGYAFSVLTINKLRKHLEKQTGTLLSYTRFRALLSKHDYVHRQPKHDLSDLQDADAKAVAEEFLDWLKKVPHRDCLRPPLCGRNERKPASDPAALLDETRTAQNHSCARVAALHPYLRRLPLARWHRLAPDQGAQKQ
jgi:transposase